MSKTTLTPSTLQQQLWETLIAVKGKKLNPKEANAVAVQAREICRITKVQLDYYRITNKSPKNSVAFLDNK